ncbi:MAG: hypothetical protein JNL98_09580 [Bryobacterales bacterium]|nr:hypothetical protein [Bryobacterales bacterium]
MVLKLLGLIALVALPMRPQAEDSWPRTVQSGAATVSIYQPQVDRWDGFKLEMHGAVSVQPEKDASPVFGAITLEAKTLVDKPQRLVTLEDLKVVTVSFPSNPPGADSWNRLIRSRMQSRSETIGLDRLEAAMAVLEESRKTATLPLNNEAPGVVFSSVPAILVLIDGEPVYRAAAGRQFERVVNTRPLLVRSRQGRHYLRVFDGWMEAASLDGEYKAQPNVPSDLEKVLEQAVTAKAVDLLDGADPEDDSSRPSLKSGPVPRIIVTQSPAELIVTEGEPDWTPIAGTQLLYVRNTTAHVFRHLVDQNMYLLLAGRWYRARGESGPWSFIEPDQLPPDFASIPDDSPKENVKASVAGTVQAQEAVIANEVPQTAKVDRKTATFTPEFDGEPQVAEIEGTELKYVTNCAQPVIVAGPSAYYAVNNGVWFTAASLRGRWTVAVSVPPVIYSIPPRAPLHYVTYVRVYDVSPQFVWAGYTPGYLGAHVSRGVVVFGTGWRYRPWIGSVWYGRPSTFGLGVGITYTPWGGWHFSFGFGWSWGRTTLSFGWGWGSRPWWGPWRADYPWIYRPRSGAVWGPRGSVGWGRGGWAGTTGNVYTRWGSTRAVTRASRGYDRYSGTGWSRGAGASYNSRTGVLSAGQRATIGNVYTGDYATRQSGSVTNTRTGASVSGGRVTAGNAQTGDRVTAGQVTVDRRGQSTTASGIRNERGGIGKVGDDIYASRDGKVYRREKDGSWQQQNKNNRWEGVSRDRVPPNINRDSDARTRGEERWRNYREGGYRNYPQRTEPRSRPANPRPTPRPSRGR